MHIEFDVENPDIQDALIEMAEEFQRPVGEQVKSMIEEILTPKEMGSK